MEALTAQESADMKKIVRLKFQAHCDDRFVAFAKDADGNIIAETEGYVPSDLGIGGSDDVELEIDLNTGMILNWKRPSDWALLDAFWPQP